MAVFGIRRGDRRETEMVARRAARSPPPHAPGARMTVVTLFLFLIDRVVRRAKESFGPTVCTISWLLSSVQSSEYISHLACAVGV